jgi:hypothetical protein
MDQDMTANELTPVAILVRRTLERKASEITVPTPFQRVAPQRPPRPWVAVAACAVLVAATGSLLGYRVIAPDDRHQAVGTPTPTSSAEPDQVQWYLPGQIPAGYVLTDLRASPSGPMFADLGECPGGCPPTVSMTLTPEGRGVAMFVSVGPDYTRFSPGSAGYEGVDTVPPEVVVEVPDDIETIAGNDYAVFLGDTTVSVTSIQGDLLLHVGNAYDRESALAVATSLRPVPVEAAREAAAEINELLRGYPEVAGANLADGTRVTVRRAEGVDDVAVALCVAGADPNCVQPPADADPGSPAHVMATLENGQERRIVSWHETQGQLELVVFGAPDSPLIQLPTEVVAATNGEGWFASAVVLADDPGSVALAIGADAELGYAFPPDGVRPR